MWMLHLFVFWDLLMKNIESRKHAIAANKITPIIAVRMGVRRFLFVLWFACFGQGGKSNSWTPPQSLGFPSTCNAVEFENTRWTGTSPS